MASIQDHDFAIYDLHLRYCGGSKGNDLLQVIADSTAYLVDNNVPWKRLASSCPDKVFALGRTISDESDNPHGILFGKDSVPELRNVFIFGLEPTQAGVHFVIHRLDDSYIACFKSSLPRLAEMTESDIALFNSPAKRDELRQEILVHMQKGPAILDHEIEELLPLCRGSFEKSCLAAEIVYARFLLSLSRSESQKELKKFQDNHPNLFGDTRLIQEALMLGLRIATCDKRDVVRMSAIAKITTKLPEQIAPPNGGPATPLGYSELAEGPPSVR